MNRSAALCGGNRRRWRRQWSSECTGNTSCGGRSNLRPTNTARRQRDNETRIHRQRQKDFSLIGSVSFMEMARTDRSLVLVFQVRTHLLPPGWSFRVSFSYILLLPSTPLTSCDMRTWGSLSCDYSLCLMFLLFLPFPLHRVNSPVECYLLEEHQTNLTNL